MTYIFGIVFSTATIILAISHLQQEAHNFWDFVGFVCVVGGTFSVAIMTFPWQYKKQIFSSVKKLIFNLSASDKEVIDFSLKFISNPAAEPDLKNSRLKNSLSGQTLLDAHELIGLGFGKEKVMQILDERIHQASERFQKVSMAFRSLAKYPPAFGLTGTVLGLVTLMRKVSEGGDAKQTGVMMAIALMATFYGLLTANLVINPAGENLAKINSTEKKQAEICLNAVAMYFEGATLLEAQELLNSYASPENRTSLLSQYMEEAS